jgi:hypothetical protein
MRSLSSGDLRIHLSTTSNLRCRHEHNYDIQMAKSYHNYSTVPELKEQDYLDADRIQKSRWMANAGRHDHTV